MVQSRLSSKACDLHLGRGGAFDLLPGLFHDIFVIVDGFFAAEALHLFGDGFHQVDHHGLKQLAARRQVVFTEGEQEFSVRSHSGHRAAGSATSSFKRFFGDDRRGAFLDRTEQDHGQDLIHGLFHQNGGFDRGQTAFDAHCLQWQSWAAGTSVCGRGCPRWRHRSKCQRSGQRNRQNQSKSGLRREAG